MQRERNIRLTFERRKKAKHDDNPNAEGTTEGEADPPIPPSTQEAVVTGPAHGTRRATARKQGMSIGGSSTSREIHEEGDTSRECDHEEEDDYVIQHRPSKGPADPYVENNNDNDYDEDDDDDDDDDANDYEEEVELDRGGAQQDDISAPQAFKFRVTHGPPSRPKTNYKAKGMTAVVRELREQDPRALPRTALDYRFHNMFQQDFYETVILTKDDKVSRSQWIDWEYMANKKDAVFDQVISTCERLKGFKHDWNDEIIAQFYATLYVEENGVDPKKWYMHWRTEGNWHQVDYVTFGKLFGFAGKDFRKFKIHSKPHLHAHQMKFMYPENATRNYGKVSGLYSYYSYLNRMIRKTLVPKDGDPANITFYTKNLLARMDPRAEPFSVFNFVWEEIKSISQFPMKNCGYAPYIMHMIESVTKEIFVKDVEHKPLKIICLKDPIVPRVPGASSSVGPDLVGTSSVPSTEQLGSQRQRSVRRGDKPPSPIRVMHNILFGLCKKVRDLDEKAHQERVRARETTMIHDQIFRDLHRYILPDAPAPPPIPVAPASPPLPPLDSYIEQLQQEDYFTRHYGTESSMSYGYVPTHSAGPSTAPPVFASAPAYTSAPAYSTVPAYTSALATARMSDAERIAHTAANSIFSSLPSLSSGFASHTFSDTQTQLGSTTYWQQGSSSGTFFADPSTTRGNCDDV